MDVQESAVQTRAKIRVILDQRLPTLTKRAWPAYLAVSKDAAQAFSGVEAAKLHCQMRQAAIETGFNYEDATEIAIQVVKTRKTGEVAPTPEVLEVQIRPAFDVVFDPKWSSVKNGVMLASIDRIARNLERQLDPYAEIIQGLKRQMDRIEEEHLIERPELMQRVAEISKVSEKLVWRIASGGKRVILTHVTRVARALNQIEASGD
jgi:hypothetical protein